MPKDQRLDFILERVTGIDERLSAHTDNDTLFQRVHDKLSSHVDEGIRFIEQRLALMEEKLIVSTKQVSDFTVASQALEHTLHTTVDRLERTMDLSAKVPGDSDDDSSLSGNSDQLESDDQCKVFDMDKSPHRVAARCHSCGARITKPISLPEPVEILRSVMDMKNALDIHILRPSVQYDSSSQLLSKITETLTQLRAEITEHDRGVHKALLELATPQKAMKSSLQVTPSTCDPGSGARAVEAVEPGSPEKITRQLFGADEHSFSQVFLEEAEQFFTEVLTLQANHLPTSSESHHQNIAEKVQTLVKVIESIEPDIMWAMIDSWAKEKDEKRDRLAMVMAPQLDNLIEDGTSKHASSNGI